MTAERGTATSYTISLEQVPQETLESGIEGVVRLEGQADEQHGDVRVETSGRGFAAVTTSTGAFRLRLPPGSYDLRFTKAGYTAQVLPNVIVTAGASKQVDTVLLSRDLSGGVSGRLTSSIEGFPWPLSATVELFRSDAATDAITERTTQPDANGQFAFSLVQPGAYFIQAQAEGYVDRLVPFRIGQDTTQRLGHRHGPRI